MNQQKWVRKRDAIEEIAPYCYPEDYDPRTAKNKVRSRVDYAVKKEQLKQFKDGRSWKFNRNDFVQWAAKKWPELRMHISLPANVQVRPEGLSISGLQPSLFVTPSDPQELKVLLDRCRDELSEARAEIDRLKSFEQKWQEEEEKKNEQRRKQSEAARKPRGPRTKS